MNPAERVDVPRCTCTHTHANHTRGVGQCWQAMCGCARFEDKRGSQ